MEPEFWHQRWATNQIGFHQEEVEASLEEYWHKLGLREGSRVLVPLCGKSLDLLWLEQQGHRVAGIEISPQAVEAFFTENRLQTELSEHDDYTCRASAGIEIYCGDFFNLTNTQIGHVDAFYDRAALVALPPDQRGRYATHLLELLTSKSSGLLVTLDYNPEAMDGPPFPVSPDEVEKLFGQDFHIEHLLATDVLDTNPTFRERGLCRLTGHAFRMVRN